MAEKTTKIQFVDGQGNVVTEENFTLREGDRMILTCDQSFSLKELQHISDQMRKFMEGEYKVAILPVGMSPKILRVEG